MINNTQRSLLKFLAFYFTLCSGALFAQQFSIENDSYTIFGEKNIISAKDINLKLNDYPILPNEKCKIYKQDIIPNKHQPRIYVYPNLGVILSVSQYNFGVKSVEKKILSVSFPFNSNGANLIPAKGNKKGVKITNYYSQSINVVGEKINPLVDYDDILGENKPLDKYSDKTFENSKKNYAVFRLNHFYITMTFDNDEKLILLSFGPANSKN